MPEPTKNADAARPARGLMRAASWAAQLASARRPALSLRLGRGLLRRTLAAPGAQAWAADLAMRRSVMALPASGELLLLAHGQQPADDIDHPLAPSQGETAPAQPNDRSRAAAPVRVPARPLAATPPAIHRHRATSDTHAPAAGRAGQAASASRGRLTLLGRPLADATPAPFPSPAVLRSGADAQTAPALLAAVRATARGLLPSVQRRADGSWLRRVAEHAQLAAPATARPAARMRPVDSAIYAQAAISPVSRHLVAGPPAQPRGAALPRGGMPLLRLAEPAAQAEPAQAYIRSQPSLAAAPASNATQPASQADSNLHYDTTGRFISTNGSALLPLKSSQAQPSSPSSLRRSLAPLVRPALALSSAQPASEAGQAQPPASSSLQRSPAPLLRPAIALGSAQPASQASNPRPEMADRSTFSSGSAATPFAINQPPASSSLQRSFAPLLRPAIALGSAQPASQASNPRPETTSRFVSTNGSALLPLKSSQAQPPASNSLQRSPAPLVRPALALSSAQPNSQTDSSRPETTSRFVSTNGSALLPLNSSQSQPSTSSSLQRSLAPLVRPALALSSAQPNSQVKQTQPSVSNRLQRSLPPLVRPALALSSAQPNSQTSRSRPETADSRSSAGSSTAAPFAISQPSAPSSLQRSLPPLVRPAIGLSGTQPASQASSSRPETADSRSSAGSSTTTPFAISQPSAPSSLQRSLAPLVRPALALSSAQPVSSRPETTSRLISTNGSALLPLKSSQSQPSTSSSLQRSPVLLVRPAIGLSSAQLARQAGQPQPSAPSSLQRSLAPLVRPALALSSAQPASQPASSRPETTSHFVSTNGSALLPLNSSQAQPPASNSLQRSLPPLVRPALALSSAQPNSQTSRSRPETADSRSSAGSSTAAPFAISQPSASSSLQRSLAPLVRPALALSGTQPASQASSSLPETADSRSSAGSSTAAPFAISQPSSPSSLQRSLAPLARPAIDLSSAQPVSSRPETTSRLISTNGSALLPLNSSQAQPSASSSLQRSLAPLVRPALALSGTLEANQADSSLHLNTTSRLISTNGSAPLQLNSSQAQPPASSSLQRSLAPLVRPALALSSAQPNSQVKQTQPSASNSLQRSPAPLLRPTIGPSSAQPASSRRDTIAPPRLTGSPPNRQTQPSAPSNLQRSLAPLVRPALALSSAQPASQASNSHREMSSHFISANGSALLPLKSSQTQPPASSSLQRSLAPLLRPAISLNSAHPNSKIDQAQPSAPSSLQRSPAPFFRPALALSSALPNSQVEQTQPSASSSLQRSLAPLVHPAISLSSVQLANQINQAMPSASSSLQRSLAPLVRPALDLSSAQPTSQAGSRSHPETSDSRLSAGSSTAAPFAIKQSSAPSSLQRSLAPLVRPALGLSSAQPTSQAGSRSRPETSDSRSSAGSSTAAPFVIKQSSAPSSLQRSLAPLVRPAIGLSSAQPASSRLETTGRLISTNGSALLPLKSSQAQPSASSSLQRSLAPLMRPALSLSSTQPASQTDSSRRDTIAPPRLTGSSPNRRTQPSAPSSLQRALAPLVRPALADEAALARRMGLRGDMRVFGDQAAGAAEQSAPASPGQAAERPALTRPLGAQSRPAAAVMRSPIDARGSAPQPPEAPDNSPPEVADAAPALLAPIRTPIQRTPAPPSEQPAQRTATAADTAEQVRQGQGESGAEAEPPDIEALAQQVYARLRRRLAIEAERLGRI